METSGSFVVFRIHFETNFGQNIFVTGNLPELGNWNPSKALKLQWISNHYWIGKLSILPEKYPVEYKYVLINSNEFHKALWEKGNNRLLNHPDNSKSAIFLNDVWNHREVKIKLPVEQDRKKKWMYITGSVPQLGNFHTLQKMKLSLGNNCIHRKSYWKIKFYLPADVKQFHYLFALREIQTQKYFFERREQRVANLYNVYKMNKIQCLSNTKIKVQLNTHENNLQSYKNNQFLFADYHFSNTEFSANITGNLMIGNFPYSQSEIDQMLKYDIKAVLNINNFGEYSRKSINWEIITEKYANNNFEFVDFLLDANQQDKTQYETTINKAVDLLNDMIIKYKKVFLHGTLGKKIPTEIALKYLCKYKHFSQDAAIKFLHYHKIPKNLTPTIKQKNRTKNRIKRQLECTKEVSSRIMKILVQASFQIAQ